MSETDTDYKYRSDRVLIETARMYRPLFSPATVYLTGAQVEMLRNMTQYLNRPNTYVEEYGIEEYTTPDAANFDVIQAIVADLEEKLMGNPNTIWGYDDRLHVKVDHTKVGAGTYTLPILTVPADVVYVVNVITSNNAGTVVLHTHQVCEGNDCMNVHSETPSALGVVVVHTRASYVLKEGDKVKIIYTAAQDGDYLVARVWGYKMVVP